MQEQFEPWQLRAGTWLRDLRTESWRLDTTANGTVVSPKLSAQDVGRLIGASRDTATGEWFPSDFNYSQQTGSPLHVTIPSLDSPWVPPYGASALRDTTRPLARGLRQTPSTLGLARMHGRAADTGEADRMLPPLAPGRYRFLVHGWDVVRPTLMAIDPGLGDLHVLLPESKTWATLDRPAGGDLAQGLRNARGWRMEVVETTRGATAYLPTAKGLAAVAPSLMSLACTVDFYGDGPALGGPVAWAGGVWLPVLAKDGQVHLICKRPNAAKAAMLPTDAPVPRHGFEAPVFNFMHMNWPSDEGQLVVRLDHDGNRHASWIPWPEGWRPMFATGSPYLAPSGMFWQLCRGEEDGAFAYVQMAEPSPERMRAPAPRLCTGHVSWWDTQRIDGDPWQAVAPAMVAGSEPGAVVVPLIESDVDSTVVGLRMHARQGALALLESHQERHRAMLQVQAKNRPPATFGTLDVTRPWLASVFVYEAHLWVHHTDLPRALGWKLGF